MSVFEIAFVSFALIFSAFVKGSLGLGFSTICLAILVHVIDLKTAISIVIFPSLLSNLLVIFDAGHIKFSLKAFWLMFLMAVPGMLLGLQLLRQSDASGSLLILSTVLIVYGVWGIRNHTFRLSREVQKVAHPIIGFTTGMVNGATGSQIFPIMPYLLSLPISKDLLVVTINISFTLCSIIMLAGLYYLDELDVTSTMYFSLAIIPVMLGVWFGNAMRKRLNDDLYRRMAMLLLIFLGLALLARILI